MNSTITQIANSFACPTIPEEEVLWSVVRFSGTLCKENERLILSDRTKKRAIEAFVLQFGGFDENGGLKSRACFANALDQLVENTRKKFDELNGERPTQLCQDRIQMVNFQVELMEDLVKFLN